MATFNLAARTYAPGETFTSSAVTIPDSVVEARITLNISVAQALDPTTDVEGRIEWAPQGTPSDSPDWKLVGATRMIGNPANNTSKSPFISVSPQTMSFLHGNLTRGLVLNRGAVDINFSATVIIT